MRFGKWLERILFKVRKTVKCKVRFALVLNSISLICEKCKYDPLEISGVHISDSSICVRQSAQKPGARILEFKNHSHGPLTTLQYFTNVSLTMFPNHKARWERPSFIYQPQSKMLSS